MGRHVRAARVHGDGSHHWLPCSARLSSPCTRMWPATERCPMSATAGFDLPVRKCLPWADSDGLAAPLVANADLADTVRHTLRHRPSGRVRTRHASLDLP